MAETESKKEAELRGLINSLRPTKSVLWGDGLGVLVFWMFAFLPYAGGENESARDMMLSWTLLMSCTGIMCLGRFSAASSLRERIDSGLAKIDGERDPHERMNNLREFLARDIRSVFRKKGATS